MSNERNNQQSTQVIEITPNDLPLHCPVPGKQIWDLHPKVYLPIADNGFAQCPYCGAQYVLVGDAEGPH